MIKGEKELSESNLLHTNDILKIYDVQFIIAGNETVAQHASKFVIIRQMNKKCNIYLKQIYYLSCLMLSVL